MENDSHADRRKYSRTPINLKIDVKQIGSDDVQAVEDIYNCKCRDISGGGISFYSTNSYPLQSVLRLHFSLDELDIKVMGKVMWSKRLPVAPTCLIGIQFLNIYEEDFDLLFSSIKTRYLQA